MTEVEEFRDLVFEEYDVGKELLELTLEYDNARVKRPIMKERKQVLSRQLLREAYRAPHQWHFVIAPIWEWCVWELGASSEHAWMAEKAMIRLYESTAECDAYRVPSISVYEHLYHIIYPSDAQVLKIHVLGGGISCLANAAVRAFYYNSMFALRLIWNNTVSMFLGKPSSSHCIWKFACKTCGDNPVG